MAPTKPAGKTSNKSSGAKGKSYSSSANTGYRVSKSKAKAITKARPAPQQQKTKARTAPELLKKKKKREYTEKELDLPTLNMITPVGVTKPKGKKKGKVFVDDKVRGVKVLCPGGMLYWKCEIGG